MILLFAIPGLARPNKDKFIIQDTVYGAVGAEDIAVHPSMPYAFISSEPRRENMSSEEPIQGGIYGLDMSGSQPYLQLLTLDFPYPLHPLGVSFYADPSSGEERLFVVNRRENENFIEIFAWHEKKLTHLESLQSPLLVAPNDVQAVGLRKFYFTNDHGSATRIGNYFEDLLGLKKSNVVYFDGTRFSVAASHLPFANGIVMDLAGERMYVSSTRNGKIYAYYRDETTGALSYQRATKVCKGLDNLTIDANDNVWVAAHPNLIKLVGHKYLEDQKSPWRVYKVGFNAQMKGQPELIYSSKGDEISAVSVAAPYKNKLILGSLFEKYILVGRLLSSNPFEASAE